MKTYSAFLLVLALLNGSEPGSQSSLPATSVNWQMKFADFGAGPIYGGKSARPLLVTETERMFRTTIRRAARKGPNFAARYTIVEWGRGSGLTAFVVLDVATGRVYDGAPFDFIDVPFQGASNGRDYQGLVYKPNSRLLIADGCLPPNSECGTHYYEWKQGSFSLLRFDPLERSRK
jgi:hypothetical protein